MTQKPRAGVIGNPIGHSLSPKLHGYWLRRYRLEGEYTAIQVVEDQLEARVRDLQAQGFAGINVTIPHKVNILQIADHVSDRATLIGAANTITFTDDGRIMADNTDAYGFMANLKQGAPAWDPKAGPAMIFGAGGAARAIIVALAEAGVPEIILTNRTRSKADALKNEFGQRVRVVDWVQADIALEDATTVINSTSLGMKGAADFKVPLDRLQSSATVTDIVYNPLRTPFLNAAEAKGCTTVDGLGMLLHQGVPGFERWFGQRPQVDEDTRRAILA
ncbi:shikimate dehydrogenase [Yoonia sediminilitoris]|uniref:Shikimate dehydrogenase (NADP(+)) n=1 Tax=Yoonia sediminilitoris TaxID=1286148 RepID=A0A2T6KLU3_9RHOB|nr:shikimate dehydrogenase [Yoonia sediminilitoris]PUB17182.1 shikimate dehydrogenase [Yoonia sediminilitoris]RCW97477.1 shikimate dehydrogenase [Yoonia sediminilitoris]